MPTLLQLKKGCFHSSEGNENMYSEHFLPSDSYSSSKSLTQYNVFNRIIMSSKISRKCFTFRAE